jgi:hypothetical protein
MSPKHHLLLPDLQIPRLLEDRSFDVDDEEFELEAAFERNGDDLDTDEDDDDHNNDKLSQQGPLSGAESGEEVVGDDTAKNSASSDSDEECAVPCTDVYPDDVADSMVAELKEIGRSYRCMLTVVTFAEINTSIRHVPLYPEVRSGTERPFAKAPLSLWCDPSM